MFWGIQLISWLRADPMLGVPGALFAEGDSAMREGFFLAQHDPRYRPRPCPESLGLIFELPKCHLS